MDEMQKVTNPWDSDLQRTSPSGALVAQGDGSSAPTGLVSLLLAIPGLEPGCAGFSALG